MTSSAVRWLVEPQRHAPDDALHAVPALPPATLQAMAAEGLVTHIGAGIHVPTDAQCSTTARAAAFAPLLPHWGVVGLEAAAWVLGGPTPSPPFTLLADAAVGSRRTPEGIRVMESSLPDADVVTLAGVRVTSPARTAADLARWGSGQRALAAFTWLVSGPTTTRQARAVLVGNPRFRHNRRARDRLRAAAAGRPSRDLWAEPQDAPDS